MQGPENGRGGLGTIRNAVRLLELLADGPAFQQLTELAEQSGMPVPTVHRLLRSMVLADLVSQDPRSARYGLGPELARLSHHYLSRNPLLGALSPYLVQLRNEVSTTVSVVLLVRGEAVYVDRVDADDRGPYRDVPRPYPALSTAAGRILAARSSSAEWRGILEKSPPEAREQAEAERETWSAAPWLAVPSPDPTLAAEVAVPVLDSSGETIAALTANVTDAGDEAACADLASRLARTALVARRTLGNA